MYRETCVSGSDAEDVTESQEATVGYLRNCAPLRTISISCMWEGLS